MNRPGAATQERSLPARLEPLAVLAALVRRPVASRGVAYFERLDGGGATREAVLAFDPLELIRSYADRAKVHTAAGTLEVEGDPFGVVQQRLEAVRLPRAGAFRGGALGYFSYDCARLLEPSLTTTAGNLRCAGSDSPDAEVALFRQALVIEPHAGRATLTAIGDGPVEPIDALLDVPALPAFSGIGRPLEPSQLSPMLGRERYMRGVEQLKEHILAGDIFQAVLAEKFTRPFSKDPLGLFLRLCDAAPSPYRFYFTLEGRTVLGSSPEMLLEVHGEELETHPIAGTRRRGDDPTEDRALQRELEADEKERAEHLMLVDLARNDLGRVAAPGSVAVHDFMQVQRFGPVMHLVSRVTARRRANVSALEALARCFPAGTLSGAPKIRAMQLLSGLEPEPRGFYGGAFIAAGFDGDLSSCISIRSVRVEQGQAVVQAGAGIVADSVPAAEYDEVLHKTRLTRAVLAAEEA
jgi:anthranilate synthase component 1